MTRWLAAKVAAAALLCGAAATARADEPPAVSLLVDETVVTVRARGVAPKRDRLQAHHDHLDIHLAEAPSAPAKVSVDDPLLKRIELTDGQEPKLQIFVHDTSTLEALEKLGRVERRGNDLRVTLPRDPARALAASGAGRSEERAEKKGGDAARGEGESAERSDRAERADKAAAAPEKSEKSEKSEKKGDKAQKGARGALAPAQVVKAEEVPQVAAAAAAAPPAPAAAKAEGFPVGVPDPKPMFGGSAESSGSGALVLLLMVALAGGGAYVVKRYRQQQAPIAEGRQIRVVTSTALGPRLRLVLVRVREREMLLSVSDRGARLLDRWRWRAEGEGAGEEEVVAAAVDAAALVEERAEQVLAGRAAAHALAEPAAQGAGLVAAGRERAAPVAEAVAVVEEDVDLRGIEVPAVEAERGPARARPESVQIVAGGSRSPAPSPPPPLPGQASLAVQGLLRLRLERGGQPGTSSSRPATPSQGTTAAPAAANAPGDAGGPGGADPQWASNLRSAMSARSGAA